MKLGSLGILTKEIFDPTSSRFVDKNYVYLTVAVDKIQEYKDRYPKIKRTVFEASWCLVEKTKDVVCVAMYLSESLVPDEVISTGEDFKILSLVDNAWKYYKVLFSYDNTVQTVYLHERCLDFFTWIHKEDTGSREGV